MAETRTITIELVDSTTREESGSSNDGNTGGRGKRKKLTPEEELMRAKAAFWSYAAQRGSALIKQAVSSSANRYFSLTEDYIAQNTYNNITGALGEVLGAGSIIFSGYKIGAAVSSIGGVAGGVIAAAAYVGGKTISTFNEMSTLRQSINTNNYNMQFQRTRMGLVDNGRGTEN